MTPKEIREKSDTERQKIEKELKEELFRLRLKRSTGQLEKIHRVGEVKRDLARLLTIKSELRAPK